MGSTELRYQMGDGAEASTVAPPPARPAPSGDLAALAGQTLSHYASTPSSPRAPPASSSGPPT